jgi:acyl-coenzyme A synthetase/AMP-(fatty) acid ligase
MTERQVGYEAVCREFRWDLPATFNFGRDVVDAFAKKDPDKLALIACDETGYEERFSFGHISELSARLANALVNGGVRRGDRVIVMLPRIPQWQIAMVACLKVGAVPVPCIEMLTEKDVSYRLAHSGAVAAVTNAASTVKFKDAGALRVRIAVGRAPGWSDFEEVSARESAVFEAADLDIDEPAIIYYTSGSTGMPKGVTHAARALYCWKNSAWAWQGLREDDLIWCTADTGWSKAGTSILFGPWSRGSAVLFYNGRFDPLQRLEAISRYGVNVFCGAATEFRRIVNQDVSRFDLSSLRLAVSAGESVNPEVVHRWQQLTKVPLVEGYGQTETLMTVTNSPGEEVRAGSMGRPLPGLQMTIIDEAGTPLPRGEVGQLALRLPSPQLMLGYWNDPERTARTRIRHDGVEYFLTGDLASMDVDGYIYYAGRTDDIISSAGYRIGPMEVENALMEHPAVAECAVVGSPDATRGETVKAFVILRPGVEASDDLVLALQEHVKATTAPYKYPRAIQFVTELPRTSTGKLLRRVLRERETQGTETATTR